MSKKLILGAVLGVAALAASGVASAHVDLSVGIGVPAYAAPAPVYVAPPPVAYAPVGYRYDDWRARQWREHEWRRREWREHEWRDHDRGGWHGDRWN
ncbi:hypothetical protein [Burkholderia metallica]|uniref:Uncharacterized protein n=1 Tax=Burkholderia metallica TaxID=488729 RepID=A0ABT8PJM0_9BURK|nr:hypothetical protein [Burkholderia metallica]AOJ30044.1 hypothetical protein WJ16_00140 [Burkholderia metallica]MCA8002123.1 hypothetical protein [Burkholderia metallica]MCA8021374.1 hypothetical protein [Burkholderia metallica]MDN7935347.1 hypothetical protein [Burkholderia metallica]VWC26109.1 signal peptide protein [Burkholderia metallica]